MKFEEYMRLVMFDMLPRIEKAFLDGMNQPWAVDEFHNLTRDYLLRFPSFHPANLDLALAFDPHALITSDGWAAQEYDNVPCVGGGIRISHFLDQDQSIAIYTFNSEKLGCAPDFEVPPLEIDLNFARHESNSNGNVLRGSFWDLAELQEWKQSRVVCLSSPNGGGSSETQTSHRLQLQLGSVFKLFPGMKHNYAHLDTEAPIVASIAVFHFLGTGGRGRVLLIAPSGLQEAPGKPVFTAERWKSVAHEFMQLAALYAQSGRGAFGVHSSASVESAATVYNSTLFVPEGDKKRSALHGHHRPLVVANILLFLIHLRFLIQLAGYVGVLLCIEKWATKSVINSENSIIRSRSEVPADLASICLDLEHAVSTVPLTASNHINNTYMNSIGNTAEFVKQCVQSSSDFTYGVVQTLGGQCVFGAGIGVTFNLYSEESGEVLLPFVRKDSLILKRRDNYNPAGLPVSLLVMLSIQILFGSTELYFAFCG